MDLIKEHEVRAVEYDKSLRRGIKVYIGKADFDSTVKSNGYTGPCLSYFIDIRQKRYIKKLLKTYKIEAIALRFITSFHLSMDWDIKALHEFVSEKDVGRMVKMIEDYITRYVLSSFPDR
jgi:hypothetical protein